MALLRRISWMGQIDVVLAPVSSMLYSWGLMWLLIGMGIFFTIRTRSVQVRHTGAIATSVTGSRDDSHDGITSFQAFTVGLACRMGTGNIVGVALVLILGKPGAVLWIWFVVILGIATAFSEAALAQLFKVRHSDGAFRSNPVYYISQGLGLLILGGVFTVALLITNGPIMPIVQASAITASLQGAEGLLPSLGAVFVMALTVPVLLGSLRAMARMAEYLAPFITLAYLVLVPAILLTHPAQVLEAMRSIIEGASGLCQGLGGPAGGVTAALLNDVCRGLFSNEAGFGGAACVTGPVTVSHPIQQGFVQAFGVVVDTLFVRMTTVPATPVADADVLQPGVSAKESAGALTWDAIAHFVGEWSRWSMALLIVVLAYITIIGAFFYAQICFDYLIDHPWVARALQIGIIVCAGIGSVQQLTIVWTLTGMLLGLGVITDLVALVLPSRWVVGALRDWETRWSTSTAEGDESIFRRDSEYLPVPLPKGTWKGADNRQMGGATHNVPGISHTYGSDTVGPSLNRDTVSIVFVNAVPSLSKEGDVGRTCIPDRSRAGSRTRRPPRPHRHPTPMEDFACNQFWLP